MASYSLIDPKKLAATLREDAAKARSRICLATDDFHEGFWEGYALGLITVVEICEASIAIDLVRNGEDPRPEAKVVPLLKRKGASS